MALMGTEPKPLEQKAIHFPSSIELRHALSAPGQYIPRSTATTMTDKLYATHVMINANARVGFKRELVAVPETVGQLQSCGVLEAIVDAHKKIQRAGYPGNNGAFDLRQIRRQSHQAHIVAFVERNQCRQIMSLESRRR